MGGLEDKMFFQMRICCEVLALHQKESFWSMGLLVQFIFRLRNLSLSFVCARCLSSQSGPWRFWEWNSWSLGRFGWLATSCPLQADWGCSQSRDCPAWDLYQPLQTFIFQVSLSWLETPAFRLMMVNSVPKSKGKRNFVKRLNVCVPNLLTWFT